jgi:TusE/DsrC/DsvC family sulfur relay protein
MSIVEFKGVTFELDEAGYLENPEKCTREVSLYLAEKEGITLTDEHWKVIQAARNFYDKYHCDEMARMMCKDAGLEKNCIMRLFGGSIRTFEKIAGIEMTWATP